MIWTYWNIRNKEWSVLIRSVAPLDYDSLPNILSEGIEFGLKNDFYSPAQDTKKKYKRHIGIGEFLSLLEKTPRLWTLSEGSIRFNESACPIIATLGSLDIYRTKECGLSNYNAGRIMNAADDPGTEYSSLREALLKACGLAEDLDEEDLDEEDLDEEDLDEEDLDEEDLDEEIY